MNTWAGGMRGGATGFNSWRRWRRSEAVAQSGLQINDENRERVGIIMGTGVGGVQTLVAQEEVVQNKGVKRVSPLAITMIMPNGAAGMMAIDFGIQGPSSTITTACAAGCDAVGHGMRAIQIRRSGCLSGGRQRVDSDSL
jgi:3-oxoacyl-[acyl-carrier-protein] synthase II